MHGSDRYFYSDPEFVAMIERGCFLEHVRYVDHRYGTPRDEVVPHLDAGSDVLLEIEVEGGIGVRNLERDVVLVFVAPPSISALERRLAERGDLSRDQVDRRLARAKTELLAAESYDYLIVNEDERQAEAADLLGSIVAAERCRVARPITIPHVDP